MGSKILISILLFAAMLSCKPVKLSDSREVNTVIVERVKDTTFYVTDSSSIQALLECDSLGNVLVKELREAKAGKYLPVPVVKATPSAKADGNIQTILNIDCGVDSASIYLTWKERDTSRMEKETITYEKVIKRPWNNWQKIQLWTGRLSVLFLIGFIAYKTKVLKILKIF